MRRVYGRHAVEELLEAAPEAVAAVLLEQGARGKGERGVLQRAETLGVPVREEPRAELRRRGGGRGSVRLAADVRLPEPPAVESLVAEPSEDALLFALDGVTDPRNLGAIIRTAAAFEARAVVMPRDRTAPLDDAAMRASAGGAARVPVLRVVNLARALRTLAEQGWWSMATRAEAGEPPWRIDLRGPLVVALGAEGAGLRRGVLRACDRSLRLPLPGSVSSLNVGVLAGALGAEVLRQRTDPGP